MYPPRQDGRGAPIAFIIAFFPFAVQSIPFAAKNKFFAVNIDFFFWILRIISSLTARGGWLAGFLI
jgi:hypothetical protein